MKSVFKVIAAVSLVSAANAKGFNGFYAGMDYGINQTRTKVKADSLVAGQSLLKVKGYSAKSNLGLFLGWSKAFSNCMLAGLEYASDFNFSTLETIHTRQQYILKNKRNTHSWSLMAKGGFLVNAKTSVFLGLGIKSLKHTLSYIDVAAASRNTNVKSNKVRFSSQIGLETLLSDSYSLRMTHTYTQGGKSSVTMNTAAVFSKSMSSKNIEHLTKVGVAYRF